VSILYIGFEVNFKDEKIQVDMDCESSVLDLKKKIEKERKKKIPAESQIIEFYNKASKKHEILKDQDKVDEFEDKRVYDLTMKESEFLEYVCTVQLNL